MATRTTTQAGNWSNAATWGGSASPGIGDVAVVNHAVTVDADVTVGTSPNDSTTAVITLAAGVVLTVAAGVVLVARGNLNWNTTGSGLSVAGEFRFDNSASGGSPVYAFIGSQVNVLTLAGADASNRALISAIAGQAWSCNVSNFSAVTSNWGGFTRLAASQLTQISGTLTLRHHKFDGCGRINLRSTGATTSGIVEDCQFVNTSGSAGALLLEWQTARTSGTRSFKRNTVDKFLTYLAKDWDMQDNCLLGGISAIASAGVYLRSFRHNLSRQDGTLNGGNGAIIPSTAERNYFIVDNLTGNPHFIAPISLNGVDTEINQNVFEGHTPDLIDTGDCILVNSGATAGGGTVTGRNNIVLRMSGLSVTSGCLVTLFGSGSNADVRFAHNTANINDGVDGIRGAFALGEGSSGTVIALFKSNVVWSDTAGQGYLAERVGGTVQNLITPAGADHNWTWNLAAGDNLRGYTDRVTNLTLWTAGNAVAAGVDANQGSGDPQFHDPARSVAAWAVARGYGSDYQAGLDALADNPLLVRDLVAYIFEGYRPTNPALRTSAHDGGCRGAANFCKTVRNFASLAAHRAALSRFGIT